MHESADPNMSAWCRQGWLDASMNSEMDQSAKPVKKMRAGHTVVGDSRMTPPSTGSNKPLR
jgi:hypothetical protein